MTDRCRICRHDQVDAIDADLRRGRLLGDIIAAHGLTSGTSRGAGYSALRAHRDRCRGIAAGSTCLICSHPDAALIDAALIAGEIAADVSRRLGLPKWAASYHRRRHLGLDAPPVRCIVCQHPDRDRIDDDLARGYSPGEVARVHGLGLDSVAYHLRRIDQHLTVVITDALARSAAAHLAARQSDPDTI